MKTRRIRTLVPLAVLLAAGIAYALHVKLGTLSAIGWEDIAVLCPVGALGTMLAGKTAVPHALISLALAVVGVLLVGRAFCGWVCPVPVWRRLRHVTKKKDPEAAAPANVGKPLTDEEIAALHVACGHEHAHRRPASSRHIVLGAGLLSAAVFGFPVFCLVCPIGLSFAGVFVLIALFTQGDVTASVLVIPVLLAVEVVFFRKWCSHICPVSALMSLVARGNRTLRPVVDDAKCLETAKGVSCGRCSAVCEAGIDPRRPELGAGMHECTRCRECVEQCPGRAIRMPLLVRPGKPVELAENAA